jgi:hypothetical protein
MQKIPSFYKIKILHDWGSTKLILGLQAHASSLNSNKSTN